MPRDTRSSRRSEHPTSPASRSVRAAGEALLFVVVAVAAWPFGSVDPLHEFFLSLAVLALAGLWVAHTVLTGRFVFRPDVASLALAGLVAWTSFQLLPLPEGVVAVVSPGRADWHRTLLPATEEVFAGEAGGVPRATFVPLSVNPAATRALLARLLGLLVVYAVARNWLADRESLPRLLGTLLATGVGLAAFAFWRAAAGPPAPGSWFGPLVGNSYGPFVNRNHYPDYAALCAGGGLGLLVARPTDGDWLTPRRLLVLAAVGFVLLSVPPSLSRGGILSTVAAGAGAWVLSRVGRDDVAGGWGRLMLAGAVGLALVAAATLGTSAVEARFSTLGDRDTLTTEGRFSTWRNVLAAVAPRFPLNGTGGGTFEAVEFTVRTDPRFPDQNYEFAHNEYVEALVEGGAVRLALTLLLAGGVLGAVGRGAIERRGRSVGGPLLGLWFGLAVVVFHAVTDFGVHLPAVSAAAAVVAGFAMAAARDGGFVPLRVKVRRKRSRGGEARLTELPAAAADTPAPADDPDLGSKWTGHGPAAWAAGGLVLVAALLVAVDANTRRRAAAYELAANAAAAGRLGGDATAQRVLYADARAAVRPDDPNGRLLAAEAHLQAAYEQAGLGPAALAGGPAAWAGRTDQLLAGPDLRAAVDHLRAARRASPVAGRAHARLGLLAGHFAGEPAVVHFDRAKRLLPADPEVWFASGRAALARGDKVAAFADWRQSLTLNPARLADMLAGLKGVPVADLRANLLPAEPAVSLAAADVLYPDRLRQAGDRRPFLAAAVEQVKGKAGAGGPDYAAAATAADELNRPEQAGDLWTAAVANAPKSIAVRDRYAQWLEKEERYEEAVEQLRQLQRLTGSMAVQDRIDGCYHGLKLKRAIGE